MAKTYTMPYITATIINDTEVGSRHRSCLEPRELHTTKPRDQPYAANALGSLITLTSMYTFSAAIIKATATATTLVKMLFA